MARKLTLEEKQERLDNQKRLLKFEDDVEIKTFVDLLINFFYLCKSTYISTIKNPTFVKQKTGQCRSIEDCYLITKYYFPYMNYKMVHNIVEVLCKNKELGLNSWWCYDVRRRVHARNSLYVTPNQIKNYLKLKAISYEIL